MRNARSLAMQVVLATLALAANMAVHAATGNLTATHGTKEACRVAVVGAGYGGAYFAWRLCVDSSTFACSDICVYEAMDRVGGRAYTTVAEGVDALALDMGPYRYRTQGAPTSSGTEELMQGFIETALGLPTVGYEFPDDPAFRVVSDKFGNNAGFAVPVRTMLALVEQAGGRVYLGQRLGRIEGGGLGSVELWFDTGDIEVALAEAVFLNLPWATVSSMYPVLGGANQTARECVEMIADGSASTKFYAQYDDAWWLTKLGHTTGLFRDDESDPWIRGRYHDGPLRCVARRNRSEPVHRRAVVAMVEEGRASELECSGMLLTTYTFSADPYMRSFQDSVSDVKTLIRWGAAADDNVTTLHSRRRQLRGHAHASARPAAQLLREIHGKVLEFHREELAAVGLRPEDIAPPTWGYMGSWNTREGAQGGLDATTSCYPSSGYWPTPLPAGLTRAQVKLNLLKPIAGLPIYMANTDYGDYQAWAEGSLIAVERVLAFHLAVAAPSWLSAAYYEATVLTVEDTALKAAQRLS